MKNFIFNVPKDFNHLFVDYTEKGPVYYRDKDLEHVILNDFAVTKIKTMLPDNLSKIEMSKVTTSFESVADTINYLHLWPFSHMINAEIIIDGENPYSFSLYNNERKTMYRETMEKINWKDNLFIIYTRRDGSKIGFLLFR